MTNNNYSPRKPDYQLGVMNTKTNTRGYVGSGWKNDDGSITIRLNPCVALTDNPDVTVRLFPTRSEQPTDNQPTTTPYKRPAYRKTYAQRTAEALNPTSSEDDTPF